MQTVGAIPRALSFGSVFVVAVHEGEVYKHATWVALRTVSLVWIGFWYWSNSSCAI